MADITNMTKEYNRIIEELEKNIGDSEALEYAKTKVSEMFMIFLEKIDGIIDEYEQKLDSIATNQSDIANRVAIMEKSLKGIEKDIYEEMGYDFEIICPYCNHEFVVDFNESNHEIECPECMNTIELDWDSDLDEECGDHGCNGHCCGHHHEDELEDEDDNL